MLATKQGEEPTVIVSNRYAELEPEDVNEKDDENIVLRSECMND